MTSPGKGRHTSYVGESSIKNSRLHRIFNKNPMITDKGEDRGLLYGATDKGNQTDNISAAKEAVDTYIDTISKDNLVGKLNKENVVIYFNGNDINELPDTKNIDVAVVKDPPANPYMPDLTSPGASSDNTVNFQKETLSSSDIKEKIEIKPEIYRPYLNISPESLEDKFSLGTVSPHISSPIIGTLSLGKELIMGASRKK